MRYIFLYFMVFCFTFSIAQISKINQFDIQGQRTGFWIEYSEDSLTKTETNYLNGLESGKYKIFHNNNLLLREGFMKEGQFHGEMVEYDENGNKVSELVWEMGRLVKQNLLNPDAKENGTIEEIGGKKYVWVFGLLKEVKSVKKSW